MAKAAPVKYVLGFLFSADLRQVALIKKNKPDFLAGKLNGVGGKMEPGESPEAAMTREFAEETGSLILSWREFLVFTVAQSAHVRCSVAQANARLVSRTDEPVYWYPVWNISKLSVMPNLLWMVPLACEALTNRSYSMHTRARP